MLGRTFGAFMTLVFMIVFLPLMIVVAFTPEVESVWRRLRGVS